MDQQSFTIQNNISDFDASVLKRVFDKNYTALLHYTSKKLSMVRQDTVEPEDLIHDAFVKLHQEKKDIKNISMVFKTIQNACIDLDRREKMKRRNQYGISELFKNYDDDRMIIEAHVVSALFEQVKMLTDQQQKVFGLYLIGLSTPEIAEKLKTTPRCVLNQKTNAINKLRTWLMNGSTMQGHQPG